MSSRPGGTEASWVEVHAGQDRAWWLELTLVLAALDIDHSLDTEAGYRLLVPAWEAERAKRELHEYRLEARQSPPAAPRLPAVGGSAFVPGYWCALLTIYAFAGYRVFGFRWLDAGKASAGLILEGQWWRTVTALTLHADGSHLLNNLLFGSFFGVLLAQEVGVGWAWLGLVLSGSVGNGLNAWLHTPDHTSIGASTGVFGTVGMLMGLQLRMPAEASNNRLRRYAPPVVGAVFLGMLGTAGERTDVLAHLTGVVAGMLMGWVAGGPLYRYRTAIRAQFVPAAIAMLTLAVAWWLALGYEHAS